jgi:predicted nucleotidyltransferase
MKTNQRRRKSGRPDEKVLAEIVQRVVEAAQPDKIILFGSAARGEMGPDSDIDLLVIKSGKFNHWQLLTTIYRHLPGIAAVDIVLASAEDIERYGDSPYLVYYPALREGKVVYGALTLCANRPARMDQSGQEQPCRGRPG